MFFVAPSLQHFVEQAMEKKWNSKKFHFVFFLGLILGSGLQSSSSLNIEGSTLLKFQARVESDPFNSLASWDPEDDDPCDWLGVNCVDNKVQQLDLSGLSLGGTLAPELGNLSNLRALVLNGNRLSGVIPAEFGHLSKLELLDLRDNSLSGKLPAEIAKMVSLKKLLLRNNDFDGTFPLQHQELGLLPELQSDVPLASVTDNRQTIPTESWHDQPSNQFGNLESSYETNMLQNRHEHSQAGILRRRLSEKSSNLEALPAPDNIFPQVDSQPISRSSGSFPAVTEEKNQSQTPAPAPASSHSKPAQPAFVAQSNPPDKERIPSRKWVYVSVGLGAAFLLAVSAVIFCIWRTKGAKPIGPFKTGISGQLQKAFVTGVPKLNRPELESACEDFSNIIANFEAYTMYKGTLSSGVEIAVASTTVTSSLDWSELAELAYRKKIETLSRVNHKNYVNLLGYCEENEPFTRMMVFEYAPSGSLFEHLHVKEIEHLDWSARMRVIMGTAYCLQYMHHDLNPPVVHSKLISSVVYLSDDYATKLVEKPFEVLPKLLGEDASKLIKSHTNIDPTENVYDFGIMLLEIITGRLPYSEAHVSLLDWALPYLNNRENLKDLIDPLLKTIKTNELEIICQVIQDCTKRNPLQRPTMREITSRLREVIPITPDAAVPRLSPLWWAELEILSVEGT